MEFSLKTMVIFVLAVIALLMLVVFFAYTQDQGMSVFDNLFNWFKALGGS